MTPEILTAVFEANVAAGVAICAVLAIRKPVRRLFGTRAAYGLWLAAPLAAAASLLPARTIVVAAAPVAAPSLDLAVANAVQAAPLISSPVVAALWLAGAAASFAALAWRQSRFVRSLGGLVREGEYLRAKAAGAGPALLGALFPRIVLPADFESRYDSTERQVVLAHEAAHLAAGDAVVNAVTALAQCLFWFNPLVHIAARAVRVDQELACDAAVLAAHPEARRPYAQALLKAQIAATPLPLGCYWPARGSNPLKERIAMLKLETPSRLRRLCGGAGILALSLGAGVAAWAGQPAQVTRAPAASAETPVSPTLQRPAAEAPAEARGGLEKPLQGRVAKSAPVRRALPGKPLSGGVHPCLPPPCPSGACTIPPQAPRPESSAEPPLCTTIRPNGVGAAGGRAVSSTFVARNAQGAAAAKPTSSRTFRAPEANRGADKPSMSITISPSKVDGAVTGGPDLEPGATAPPATSFEFRAVSRARAALTAAQAAGIVEQGAAVVEGGRLTSARAAEATKRAAKLEGERIKLAAKSSAPRPGAKPAGGASEPDAVLGSPRP